ncbi:MAG: type II toxin-antitoxin system VapC family toxin [Candidatus Eremiobacteraeota bacterium]|nr:type II toxin-antitoxin system VapC family toxin [Candidatus Eremiobacteraeota bacterium]MCW5871359.1 type II toxin-antitoxin system VapC family toxin [Candidatus Eremiobacteraeota bacterium]
MILDTSALVAIFYGEPERDDFIRRINLAPKCSLSVASFLELFMVTEKQLGADASRQIESFLRRAGIALEPITVEQAYLARQAFLDYGKGRHPAALNFGDCFAYALSKALDEPLLFKGQDFSRTDVRIA